MGFLDEMVSSSAAATASSSPRDDILEFTKNWDLSFRKRYLSGTRKVLGKEMKLSAGSDNEEVERVGKDLTRLANGVTFDLIGISKCFRGGVGEGSVEKARSLLLVMEEEIKEFIVLCEQVIEKEK